MQPIREASQRDACFPDELGRVRHLPHRGAAMRQLMLLVRFLLVFAVILATEALAGDARSTLALPWVVICPHGSLPGTPVFQRTSTECLGDKLAGLKLRAMGIEIKLDDCHDASRRLKCWRHHEEVAGGSGPGRGGSVGPGGTGGPGEAGGTHQRGRHGMDPHGDGAGAADDAGPVVLLRRHGAAEERRVHADAELHGHGGHQPAVGGCGIQPQLRGQHPRADR